MERACETDPPTLDPGGKRMTIPPVAFRASQAVRAALSALGRTEDLRFSPDNRLLAIAGFARKRCLLLRIDIEMRPDGPGITIHDFVELRSDGIGEVHGLDFIDDRTLVVANRDGQLAIFALPVESMAGQHREITALRRIDGKPFCKLRTPGSVVARRESGGRVSLLVCNNYTHLVTRHVAIRWLGYRTVRTSHCSATASTYPTASQSAMTANGLP
ncbi:hypothetical protein [Mesorhizobium sp. BH1-1-4]|uniref:hypothetical protein n=1 Tax=Mesorhizobium sp. BH1-1-4 TaxID=2876662 RepID=UPI001CD13AFB|nr:hypothetical protein [Mesorhizobium sp. BH1-1-4]MBZ9996916.1 hypothetical protein [Mesorhizobium sp. BH1-1-4]